uniref:Uncharacterized LOC112989249 n=1 Tax=Dromaius novaehollandiae TaxID=8790 RepID=A0A8C4K9D7_DRONO
MSTVNEEVKPEDAKLQSEKKIYYCEVCKVPCMSSISLQSHYRGAKHRKKEKALRPKTVCLKRGLTKDITSLKDFMNDLKREEPLVGLEHVVEIRFEGRKEPHYECKLCGFNTEMALMIEHLSGYKHRRAYLSKEFPDKMKRKTTDVKECKVSFLRRIAGEIEKTEGLKMYKIEGCIRPSTSPLSKKKARWEDDYKRENDPIRKQKALEFLETFHITSGSEATLVVHITQELTEALKAFCEKKAAVNYANSLRPLMSISESEFPSRKSIQNHYKPYGKSRGNSNWNQAFLSQYEQCTANASFAPANSYSYQTDDGSSSYGLRPNDFEVMSALSDSFALQAGSPPSGVKKWLRQCSRSASDSNSAGGTSTYETNSVRRGSSRWNQESRCLEFRHQKSDYRSDWSSHHYYFSGSCSYGDYQQCRSSDKMFDEDAAGLTPNILNRLRGKDLPTMTRMLKQLTPYYPALQKLNIQTLVNVLIETREKD